MFVEKDCGIYLKHLPLHSHLHVHITSVYRNNPGISVVKQLKKCAGAIDYRLLKGIKSVLKWWVTSFTTGSTKAIANREGGIICNPHLSLDPCSGTFGCLSFDVGVSFNPTSFVQMYFSCSE